MGLSMKKSKCKLCEPVVVGMAWERDDNSFDRVLLRQCKICKTDRVTDLHYVDTNLPFCGACFSQELQKKEDSESGLMCSECASINILTLESPVDNEF